MEVDCSIVLIFFFILFFAVNLAYLTEGFAKLKNSFVSSSWAETRKSDGATSVRTDTGMMQ